MPPAAAIAVPAALGVLGGVSQAKQQKQYAKEAGKPKPYSETRTQAPPDWLAQLLPQLAGESRSFYENRRDNPRLPPTFLDVAQGRYGRPLPSSALGGVIPGGPEMEQMFQKKARQRAQIPPELQAEIDAKVQSGDWTPERGQQRLDRYREKNPAQLSDSAKQRISERMASRMPGQSGFANTPRPARGGGGMGGGMGMGRGAGEGGAGGMDPRKLMAQLVLQRAQQPVQGQAEGMDFIKNLLARQGGAPGGDLARQTYADFRSPQAPINQMIQRGMGGSFSSAAPMQQQLAQQMLGRMSGPAQAPVNYFDRFLGAAYPDLNLGGG